MSEIKKGDTVRIVGRRTCSEYVGCEGIIKQIIITGRKNDIHAKIEITKGTKRYPRIADTYIYLSDMKRIIAELNKQTRVL